MRDGFPVAKQDVAESEHHPRALLDRSLGPGFLRPRSGLDGVGDVTAARGKSLADRLAMIGAFDLPAGARALDPLAVDEVQTAHDVFRNLNGNHLENV